MKWWKDRFPVSITRLRNGAFLFLLLSTRRHKITSESGTRGDGGLCLIGPRAVRPSVCHLTHHYDLSTAASPLSRLSLAAGGQPQNERERGSVIPVIHTLLLFLNAWFQIVLEKLLSGWQSTSRLSWAASVFPFTCYYGTNRRTTKFKKKTASQRLSVKKNLWQQLRTAEK